MKKIWIESINHEGDGVGFLDGQVVFVPGGVVGDFLDVKITKQNKNYLEAAILKVLKPSIDRINAKCPLFTRCGGCQFLSTNYDREFIEKINLAKKTIEKFSGRTLFEANPENLMKADKPYFYRNKSELSVRKNKIGLFQKKSHFVLEFNECLLQDKAFNLIYKALKTLVIDGFDEEKNTGNIKYFVFRKNALGFVLVTIVCKELTDELYKITKMLIDNFPFIKGVVANFQPEEVNRILGANDKLLFGDSRFIETIENTKYIVSYDAFFQINPEMTPILFNKVKAFLGPNLDTLEILDLYSGVGAIGLFLAPFVKSVTGIEINKKAHQSCLESIKLNNIRNATYISGRVEDYIDTIDLTKKVVIIDPPRKGLDEKTIAMLNKRVNKLIYVSCNDATLGRDLGLLNSFEIIDYAFVDMFPRTAKIESVILLYKRK